MTAFSLRKGGCLQSGGCDSRVISPPAGTHLALDGGKVEQQHDLNWVMWAKWPVGGPICKLSSLSCNYDVLHLFMRQTEAFCPLCQKLLGSSITLNPPEPPQNIYVCGHCDNKTFSGNLWNMFSVLPQSHVARKHWLTNNWGVVVQWDGSEFAWRWRYLW